MTRAGRIVQYAQPLDGERDLTFVVVEDYGDRLLIESRDFPDARIVPTEVVAASDVRDINLAGIAAQIFDAADDETLDAALDAVALGVIDDLRTGHGGGGPKTLEYYKAHADGDCDFVWIEEGVSAMLDQQGIVEHYLACVGRVFAWLTATHGVQPPIWYRRELEQGTTTPQTQPTPLALPTVAELADAFVAHLRQTLTADEWAEMVARNAVETRAGVCHSHDFCDANDDMLAAFEDFGIKADQCLDAHATLWSAAWDHAWPALGGKP